MRKTLTLILFLPFFAFNQSILPFLQSKSLYQHLSVLAHDSLEGRETGKPGLEKAAKYIETEYAKIGLKPAQGEQYRQWYKLPRNLGKASNIIGVLEGSSRKDEYIVISAHYDHLGVNGDKVYNGADDDGSGTAALICMAQQMMDAKLKGQGPERSIVFMAFSGEEKGLWGSEYYSDNPLLSLQKTSCDLNIDMIGRIDTERLKADTMKYIYVVGHNKLSSELYPILKTVNQKKLILDYKFDSPKDPEHIYYRSDHYNFAKKGVPVLFFYDGMLLGDYHKPTDDIEKITWPLYEKRVQFIYDMAMHIANLDHLLKRDIKLE